MKKCLSILLLLTLLLSLSVSVFARYEVCPECGGRLKYETRERVLYQVSCPLMDEGDAYDDYIEVSDRPRCLECGYYEKVWNVIYYYTDCQH